MRVSLTELREDEGKSVRNPAGVMLLQCSDLFLKATESTAKILVM